MPLLVGSRVAAVNVPDDAVVLGPPPPREGIADVAAAVRDAVRFPLAGQALDDLVPRGARATLVVEPPALPLPTTAADPRQAAIAATVAELERVGVPVERQTLLMAGGLARRAGRHELDQLVAPEFARRFHGRVEVHDAEDESLVDLGADGRTPLRVHRSLVETDVVVTVTAAETVLHGGPAALVGATGSETLRAAGASSLLEPATSHGWEIGVALEETLSRRTPLLGVSLVLDNPRLGGALRGFPHDPRTVEWVAGSPLRRVFGALPGRARMRVLRSLPHELATLGAFAGPPSVAHSEALLRAVDARSTPLASQLDAVCIGVPRTTPYLPRERPNPLLASYLGLALALRLWRNAPPLAEGATVILANRFQRHFQHPTQQPYRALFRAGLPARSPDALAEAEHAAAADERALAAYREGRSCHPLLPFVDWAACAPAIARAGTVIVAGCRDAVAARQLGFVPTHGIGAALAMAEGLAGRRPQVGFLLNPPYFPISVQGASA